MQEIRISKPPVVTGILDPNKSRAQHHHSLKLDLKLKYLNFIDYVNIWKTLEAANLVLQWIFVMNSVKYKFYHMSIVKKGRTINGL